MAETPAETLVDLAPDEIVEGGEVTTAESEADFLTCAYAADAPWPAVDDAIDCATQAPQYAWRMASPLATPPGPGCC